MNFAFLAPLSVSLRTQLPGRRLNVTQRAPCRHAALTTPKACFQIPGVDMEARAKAKAAAAAAEAESGEEKVELGPWDKNITLLNLVVLTGRLGADPILRQVGSKGTPLCTFSLAVNTNNISLGDGSRHTSWFRINIWGARGERAAGMLRKGMRVGVQGPIGVDEYVDKQGRDRTTVYVTAKSFEILQSKSEFGSSASMGGASRSYNYGKQNNPPSYRKNGSYVPSSSSPPPPGDAQDPF